LPILLLRKRKLRHSLGKPSRSDFVQFEVVMAGSFDISSNIFASIPVTFSVTPVTCFSLIKDFRYIFTRKL
jgi:hypothetical protein